MTACQWTADDCKAWTVQLPATWWLGPWEHGHFFNVPALDGDEDE